MLQNNTKLSNTLASSDRSELTTIKLLMVEDDPDDYYLQSNMLIADERHVYNIDREESLSSCLQAIENNDYDAILLDLGLPDSIGLDTLKTVAMQNRSMPIVVLTGIDDDKVGEDAIKHGAEDYVPKMHANSYLLPRTIIYAIERHGLVKELQHKALIDELTQIPNRLALFERLGTLISQADRNPLKLAVAMLDLDGFKEVNDGLGHRAGDFLLQQFAFRLQDNLRSSDIVARYGGDEFILVLTNYGNREDLLGVLERKLQYLNQPIEIISEGKKHSANIGVSIGVAEYEQSIAINKLLALADQRMYRSKQNGKNQICLG